MDIEADGEPMHDASYQMIEIIFDNHVYDLGEFYRIGGFNEIVLNMAVKKTPMASTYDKYAKTMNN